MKSFFINIRNFFSNISLLNAAEATVMSFVVMSLLGGSILYITESDRIVHAKQAINLESTMTLNNVGTVVANPEPLIQLNTYIKDVTYKGETFVDMRFTAVSALCVTGLTSTDFSQFTIWGQLIVMILIQMGGLGIILFTTIFAILIVRGLSERTNFKELLANIVDTPHDEVGRMIKHVVRYTVIIEGLAFLVMGTYLQFFETNLLNGVNPRWRSLFHSISAFNNAGFGLFNNNLMSFVTDPVINITIALLIILGGLGYPVLIGIHARMRSKLIINKDKAQSNLMQDVKDVVASSVQMKLAIRGTLVLILLGIIVPLVDGYSDPGLEGYTFFQQILITFFQSVSTRTAGFNTIDLSLLGKATLFFYVILMFIGANPAGTGGGIKIPTVGVLFGYLKDRFERPRLPVMLFGKKISKFAVSHAIRLFFFSILFVTVITFLIAIFENQFIQVPDSTFDFFKIFFEVVSGFATVGLSMGFPTGVTSFSGILSDPSKILLIIAMLVGRVGPLTLLAALPRKRRYANEELSPDHDDVEKIQIG